jgi:2-amino-4-hydroxy-6-hydroxymethyldihydropteridine diphosphokinase
MMNIVYLLVGSNINARENILQCHQLLQQKTQLICHSSVYESQAAGPNGLLDQPAYYNVAYKVRSPLSVIEFKTSICRGIEKSLGRVRTNDKYAARSIDIDIDIVLYNNEIYSDDNITLPASDILTASYVLLPLVEIDGEYEHPILKRTLADICREKKFEIPVKKLDNFL